MLYFDLRLITRSSILIILSNIALVIYNIFYRGMNTPKELSSFTLQIICVVGYCANIYITAYLSNKFNASKLSSIKEEKETSKEIDKYAQA